jgi:hypothetical protein
MHRAVEAKKRQGEKMAPNTAFGRAYHGVVPHIEAAREISPVWLSYASASYFRSRTNAAVEPGFVSDASGRIYGPPGHPQLRGQWTLSESRPAFATWVTYFDDGIVRTPNGAAKRVPPYDKGFTNAIFQVDAFTNVNDVAVPLSASLHLLRPRRGGTSSNDLDVLVEYQITLTNAGRAEEITDFQPALPGITAIRDERYGVLNYFGTNEWPTVEQLQNGEYFKTLRSINMPVGMSAEPLTRRALQVALAILLISPAVVFLGRNVLKGKRKQEQTEECH